MGINLNFERTRQPHNSWVNKYKFLSKVDRRVLCDEENAEMPAEWNDLHELLLKNDSIKKDITNRSKKNIL